MTNKIRLLPGTKLTPEVLLAQIQERDPDNVIIVYSKGDKWFSTWSNMDAGTVVFGQKMLDLNVTDVLRRED